MLCTRISGKQSIPIALRQVQCKVVLRPPTPCTAITVAWSTMRETRSAGCVARPSMHRSRCSKHPGINRPRRLRGRWYVPVVVRPLARVISVTIVPRDLGQRQLSQDELQRATSHMPPFSSMRRETGRICDGGVITKLLFGMVA